MKTLFRFLALLPTLACVLGCSSSDAPPENPPIATATVCHDDAACEGGQHCDPELGCVACSLDSQCAAGQRCAQGACSAVVSCESDDDCTKGPFPVCHLGALECVECNADADCAEGASCRANQCHEPAKCAAESECTGGLHCDLGSGQCVQCVVNAQCGANQQCLTDRCVTSCSADAACDEGQHCDSAGRCRECALDEHCAQNRYCAAGSCQPDVCKQGSASCAPNGNGTRQCSDNGAHFEDTVCLASHSCVAEAGSAECQPWLCSPGQSTCNDARDGVRRCAADGLSFESSEKCDKAQSCQRGICFSGVCAANRLSCKDGNSYLCAPDGLSLSLQTTCSGAQRCDEDSGACSAKVCTPGSVQCVAGNVGTCRSNGSGYDLTACNADQACVAGACKPTVCAPSQTFCSSDGAVSSCDSSGTSATLQATCGKGWHCSANFGSATCSSNSCTPGAGLCTGSIATVCKGDGTGPEPGGTDCASANGYCSAGTCVKKACTPNQRYCDSDLVMQCSSDGSYAFNSQYCSQSGLHCNPATAACQNYACTPGSASCSNALVVQCDASGFVPTTLKDCAASGQKCSNGTCANAVCTANTSYCKGNDLYGCNADGTGEYLAQACGSSGHCNGSYCVANVCQPGQAMCNGNAVTTCAADGSGPAAAGTACAANQACVNGACLAIACSANALFCANGESMRCNAQGTGATLNQHCFSDTYCDAATGQCKADVCPNGQVFCGGEVFATCKPDGSGPVATGTNCAASSQACGLSGCAAQVTDSIGSGAKSAAIGDYMFTQLIKVSTARRLLRIDMTMVQAGGTPTWVVYSSADAVNYYRVLTPVTGAAIGSPGLVSSGPIDVQLQPGLYYMIGMYSSGTSYPYYDQKQPQISFGTVLGSIATSTSYTSQVVSTGNYNQAGAIYRMSLVTALP